MRRLALLLAATSSMAVHGFSQTPPPAALARPHVIPRTFARRAASGPVDDDEARRANLFQNLLRDLETEGVPLLGCDVDQVHTLCAALWSTMADLSESPVGQKVCLIMEAIPLDALRAFTIDYATLQIQSRLIDRLPELQRISVTLLGNGVGPALVIETSDRTEEELAEMMTRKAVEATIDENASLAALKSFVGRMVVGLEVCPYTKTPDIAAVGLARRGVTPAPVGYRFDGSSDACSALAAFWQCVCEILSVPEDELSTTVLSLPAIGHGTTRDAHDRFAAVVELISRNLCLYRGDGVLGLVHFHPAYDRDMVVPVDKPAYGHLPPRSWLRPMLRRNGNDEEAESLSDGDLGLSDYQRRSPHTAINILRVSQINAATGAKSIVDLDIGDGTTEKASGVPLYCRNAIRLAGVGKDELQRAVDAEMAMERVAY
mmetsp:Transcript_12636/g.15924  ORF Transcript_12636/g.15924 Transcript_12636/m.15924 type:complete len:432 (+) Transcript_12636:193-1488(+)|eukprot:CAMPEP_0172510602 /NCGR_PEP_ID=MMETSP1066-20121228/229855_1 /TAXON_ID=671091 /ORGANISM="Coscinodiscus wailesii, Strain CCMP2513" /LENGTH=431 /DNA_ID=CAMNT_0013289635 /DNA_START=147 /DNA_END=1442 /DNA_ORIENTATION=+